MSKKLLTTALIPELYCSDIKISLHFYTKILGFDIQYQRQEEGFVMLDRQGARLMLDEISETKRSWITAPLELPFGRGINLQIITSHVDELYDRIRQANVDIFLPLEEKWYQAGDLEIGHRQFIALDPDGYMLRFVEELT